MSSFIIWRQQHSDRVQHTYFSFRTCCFRVRAEGALDSFGDPSLSNYPGPLWQNLSKYPFGLWMVPPSCDSWSSIFQPHSLNHASKYVHMSMCACPWFQHSWAGLRFLGFFPSLLSPRWNRGTRWTASHSSLTQRPTSWSSWTSCSPELWCLARSEPPPITLQTTTPHRKHFEILWT